MLLRTLAPMILLATVIASVIGGGTLIIYGSFGWAFVGTGALLWSLAWDISDRALKRPTAKES